MNSRYLLDASALLALLFDERGSGQVELLLDDSAIHGVNLAEAIAKLLHRGVPTEDVESIAGQLDFPVIEQTTVAWAMACGRFHAAHRDLGLSIGDCVCLVTAASLGMTAVTADRNWTEAAARASVPVLCIR